MRWFATSGIIVTSELVRARMVWFTLAMSTATSAASGSINRSAGFSPERNDNAHELLPLATTAGSTIKTPKRWGKCATSESVV